VTTANHLLQVRRDALLGGGLSDADVREYGLADGLQGIEGVKRHRSVVADAQKRNWFSMNRGLSVVDPSRLIGSSPPALVRIQAVSADGRPVDLQEPLHIPAARQRLVFSYAGLSLAVPERVKYRYMLDGFDHDWSEPVATAEAIYTNLSPGAYRFRVIASNSDGLWNSAEAMIRFEIAPVFYLTWWFRLAALLVFMLAVLAFYRFRLHRVTRQLNVRFE